MIKRILIFGVLISLLQILIYYALILIFWNIGKLFYTPIKTDFTWSLTVLYSTYIFALIIMIQNILIEILFKNNLRIYLYIGALTTFVLSVQNFVFWPLKTLILIISGIIVLSIKLYLDHKIDKSKIVNHQSKI